MDKKKIILENGLEKEVSCIFYLYNSKYYFIYTEGEVDENGYIILYVVQVGKEVKNTPSGQVYTGYMVGVEISDANEWANVQKSITTIVEDKKNKTTSNEIQYLDMNMLNLLKIASKRQFKLMKSILEEDFNLTLPNNSNENGLNNIAQTTVVSTQNENMSENQIVQPTPIEPVTPVAEVTVPTEPVAPVTEVTVPTEPVAPVAEVTIPTEPVEPVAEVTVPTEPVAPVAEVTIPTEPVEPQPSLISDQDAVENNVIIDYKAKFFEEYNKNKELEQKITELNNKIAEIKSVIEK